MRLNVLRVVGCSLLASIMLANNVLMLNATGANSIDGRQIQGFDKLNNGSDKDNTATMVGGMTEGVSDIQLGSWYEDTDDIATRLHGIVVKAVKRAYSELEKGLLKELEEIDASLGNWYNGGEVREEYHYIVVPEFTEDEINLFSYELIASVMVAKGVRLNSGRVGIEIQNLLLNYGDNLLSVNQLGVIQDNHIGGKNLVATVKLASINGMLNDAGYSADVSAVKQTANNMFLEYTRLRDAEFAEIAEISGITTMEFGGSMFNTPVLTEDIWWSRITSVFGWRTIDGKPDNHTGLDIWADYGTPIRTVKDGQVLRVIESSVGYGLHVYVQHADMVTLYAHCSAIYVAEGQYVSADSVIAAVGSTGWSTGPHLHFEVITEGKRVNPIHYIRGTQSTKIDEMEAEIGEED